MTKKLKCLIVEDEPIARKIIREFIDHVDFLELAGEAENAIKAESFLQQNETDIIFLDIEMPRLSGVEYLKSRKVKPLVIITTAYPEYALEGYELDVIDYLLKPIAFTRFFKAVQKAKEYHDLARENKSVPDFIFVRAEGRIEKVDINDILFAESTGNYVTIACTQKKLTTYLTMKSLENQLLSKGFLKIHRSFLINTSHIEYLEDNHIKIGDKLIPISRHYLNEVANIINKHLIKR